MCVLVSLCLSVSVSVCVTREPLPAPRARSCTAAARRCAGTAVSSSAVTCAQQLTTQSAWARTPPTWRPSSTGPAPTTPAPPADAGRRQQAACCSGVCVVAGLCVCVLAACVCTEHTCVPGAQVVWGSVETECCWRVNVGLGCPVARAGKVHITHRNSIPSATVEQHLPALCCLPVCMCVRVCAASVCVIRCGVCEGAYCEDHLPAGHEIFGDWPLFQVCVRSCGGAAVYTASCDSRISFRGQACHSNPCHSNTSPCTATPHTPWPHNTLSPVTLSHTLSVRHTFSHNTRPLAGAGSEPPHQRLLHPVWPRLPGPEGQAGPTHLQHNPALQRQPG